MSAGRRSWSPGLLFATLLALLVVAWAPDAVLGRAAFWSHDLRHHHLPWRVWSASQWLEGRVPLWSPEVANGYPLMADSQTGVFYPPTQLLFMALPGPMALNATLLLHIFWAGLGAYALARALGRSPLAAALAGFGFGFSGFLASKALYLGFQNASAWLPWLLFAQLRRRWALMGLCAAMMLVAGHPQAAAMGLLLAGMLALIRKEILPFTAAMALALVAASPQLLATLELTGFSLRDGGLPEGLAGAGGLPVQELINGVLPRFFGFETPSDIPQTYYHRGASYWGQGENHWEMAFYLGIPLVVLALAGLRAGRGWLALAALSALLMLGDHTPVWPILRHLPGLGGFRFPARFALWLTLAVGLIAAAGLDALLGAPAERWRRWGRGLVAAAAALGLGATLAHGVVLQLQPRLESALLDREAHRPALPPPPLSALQLAALPPAEPLDAAAQAAKVKAISQGLARATDPLDQGVFWPVLLLVVLGAGALAVGRGALAPNRWGGLAVALLVADLFWFGRGYQAVTPMEEVERRPSSLDRIQAEGGRATVLDRRQDPALDTELISASLGLLWGTSDVILPSPLRIVRQEAALSAVGLDVGDRGPQKVARALAHRGLLDLLGVRWLLSVHEIPGLQLVKDGAVKLWRNPDALPRAFLVGCARSWPAEDAEAVWSALQDLDPRALALVEGADLPDLACESSAPAGRATLVQSAPERLLIQTDAPRASLLVQTDTWYPGWTATVDGAPAALLRADFLFRGVALPAGVHTVELRYEPSRLRLALALAPLAALILLAGAWRERRRA